MEDQRRVTKGNFKHELIDIIFLTISAVVSGCNDWETIEVFGESQLPWLRKFYPFKNGIPSHDTINRLFSSLDKDLFTSYFIEWAQGICHLDKDEVIAIDGKTIRGSYDRNTQQSAIHLVSAYASKNNLCLGQIQTAQKSNEITAIPELLDLLFIEGTTVTIDAMGCQKHITKKIIDKKANYVIAVKGNQKELSEQIKKLFSITKPSSEDVINEVDHGRAEIRKCSVIDNFDFFDGEQEWVGLNNIVKIEASCYNKASGQSSNQTRYYITSHKAGASMLNNIVRKHWSIENNLHWMLDVMFQEDKSRRRMGNSSHNFNVIAKFALALIERVPLKKSKRQRRFKAGFDPKFREKVLNL